MPGAEPDPLSRPARTDLRALESDVAREAVRMALFGQAGPHSIGRYHVVRRGGRGAMGAVFEAHDPELDRPVALKLLEGRTDDPAALERLERRVLHEARAMARLQHPAVTAVYEEGRHGPWVFLAMELVGGTSLRKWVSQQQPDWVRVLDAFIGVGRGLAAAHQAGLAHGDFKPDNLRFDETGRLRILDFGLARSISTVVSRAPLLTAASPMALLRSMGVEGFGGTPAYAAPERLDGAPADEASDQFSFFVSLYECLYGQRPFAGTTVEELRAAIPSGPRPPSGRGTGPMSLRSTIARGLHPDPSRRFASMSEAVAALASIRSRRARRAWLAAATILLAGGAGYGLARENEATCPAAAELASGLWEESRNEVARARPSSPGIPPWERVEAGLDTYVGAWAEAAHAACSSSRLSEEPDLLAPRLACLGHRRAAVERLLDRLGRGHEKTWESALEAVAELPDLTECGDVRLLQLPPPDPAVRDRVEALREELVVAAVDADSGDLEGAQRMAAEVVTQARELDYPPLLAEALMAHGKLLADGDRVEEAAARLRDAYGEAVASGHLRVAADTAVALVYADGYQRARSELGHHWAWIAQRLIEASPEAAGLRASLVANEAAVWVEEGDNAKADAGFARALELEQAKERPNPFVVDALLHNRGTVASRAHDYARAAEIFAQTVQRRAELYGEDHPRVARALSSLANAERELGRVEDALTHEAEALAALERHHGHDSPALRLALAGLAESQIAAGEPEQAMATARRLFSILERHVASDHPALSRANQQIAIAHLQRCEYDEAAAIFEQELERARSRSDPGPLLAMMRHNLGEVRLRQGRLVEAGMLAEQSLGYWQGVGSPLDASHPRTALGMVALRQGRYDRAETILAAELQVRREEAGADSILTAEALAGWGHAQVGLGRLEQGIEALREALQVYTQRDTHGAHQAARMQVATWLAWALAQTRGQDDPEGAALLDQARSFWLQCGDEAAAEQVASSSKLTSKRGGGDPSP